MFEDINKKRIFVFFTGHSITEIPDYIFDKLKNETTICINHSFKIFKNYDPSYIFFSDKDVLYAVWKYYQDKIIHPIIYARNKSIYEKTNKKYPELVPKDWVNNNIIKWYKEDRTHIPSTFNITPAYLFSCLMEKFYKGNIYIFGLDMYVKNYNYHFDNYHHEDYKKKNYPSKLIEYAKMLNYNGFMNLNLFNCNLKSLYNKYPKVDINTVL